MTPRVLRHPGSMAAVALVAAMALGGCGAASQASAAANNPAVDTSTDPVVVPAVDSSDDADDSNGSNVIATTTFPIVVSGGWDGTRASGTITAEVTSLHIEGQKMALEMNLTANYDEGHVDEDWTIGDLRFTGGWAVQPTFLDTTNLKQYNVLESGSTRWMAGNDTPLRNQVTTEWWGYYPIPEDDIETLVLDIFDSAAEITIEVPR